MPLRQAIKTFCLIIVAFIALSGVVHAKEMSKSMQQLIKLFELNEAGVAYLKHCDDYKKQIPQYRFVQS